MLVHLPLKSRDIFTVLSVQENLIMCFVSFLGWNAAWCRSASSGVSPHQQQSRWGPPPQAKPSHQPHVSLSPPWLASCSDHSHNKRHNIGKTAACSARGLRQKLQNFTSGLFFLNDWVCPKQLKSSREKDRMNLEGLVACQTFVISTVATFVVPLIIDCRCSAGLSQAATSSQSVCCESVSSRDEWKCSGTPPSGDRLSCGPVH